MIKESQGISEKTKNQNASNYAPVEMTDLKSIDNKKFERIKTSISELDRVLGGGLVPGSLVLLGGEPGIGKSTLALQMATILPHSIYISGEESTEQIKLRAERLKISTSTLKIGNATNVDNIISTIRQTTNPPPPASQARALRAGLPRPSGE